jgi:hypothetical protein
MHIERFLRDSRAYLNAPRSEALPARAPRPDCPRPCCTWPKPSARQQTGGAKQRAATPVLADVGYDPSRLWKSPGA